MAEENELESKDDLDDLCKNDYHPGKPDETSACPQPQEMKKQKTDGNSSKVDTVGSSSSLVPQDADYIPSLSYELEPLILARVPRSEYLKFSFVNQDFKQLLESGDIYKIRRAIGVRESSVFMLASGDSRWWVFDRQFKSHRKLPDIPSDPCFSLGDKESLCAGSHLIVSGKEIEGVVVWRYEYETNSWKKGPSMITPRCLFASASCGSLAFVAGGIGMGSTMEVLNSAEKYNPDNKSWVSLPRMNQPRKLCSGCFMDNKFYVIGGQDEEGNNITYGEAFDVERGAWELIDDMLKDTPFATFQSPPLVAVVNNELYSLETFSNELRVYLKKSNKWKMLGPVPVRADFNRGWGVAFKSLGDELLVIGSSMASSSEGMAIYTCCPNADGRELKWKPLDCGKNQLSHFILNCSVMSA
ncbi:F-box/kelch-repeat protein [Tripterygium wilfordii]|uniref:F-box/kelch-repeat protein n=1 Tax=Tripterygium wilfordii TaxID=458696 RepID=A0A7J7D276_TRIWF|nr:F-box/kelch-repeat protein At3g27150 [Tripterygium wilfordii]KAF5740462.1 F-box/kelch-repeat protein [Tripterygium wilfordii]